MPTLKTKTPPLNTETISKEAIQDLPLYAYRGDIYLVNSDATLKSVLPVIQKEPILGFDTEMRPAFRKGERYPVSLIQLATGSAVFLFQIQSIEKLDGLWKIFEGNQKKVGLAIRDDFIKLGEIKSLKPRNCIDVSTLTKKLGIFPTGLRNLSAILLKVRISKSAQTSNWANARLTPAQITYAATDAWISRELYLTAEKLQTSK
ncbi:MAG: hypothetical protein A2Y14_04865 [Verrucomicrobia bacterium GWF2_51_19]|nr:MAG: hypothetical protein A2Y14_04865 [Verrucomicrobia bacterium GWF2_51_19]